MPDSVKPIEGPEFGLRLPGIDYPDRPAAYGIVFDQAGRVASTREPFGCFLPGGGIEPGESPVEALKREFLEELGWTITPGPLFAHASCCHFSPTYQAHFRNIASFFLIERWEKTAEATEKDHELGWFSLEKMERLYEHSHHVWAVKQSLRLSV